MSGKRAEQLLNQTCSTFSQQVVNILVLQLEEMRKNEDPRLSFSTPEFKEAQRIFTDGFKVTTHICTYVMLQC